MGASGSTGCPHADALACYFDAGAIASFFALASLFASLVEDFLVFDL